MNLNIKAPEYQIPNQFHNRVTRTTAQFRPPWLNVIRRPLRIIARDDRQCDLFIRRWRFHPNEFKRVLDGSDLIGINPIWPILLLPGSTEQFADYFPSANPLLMWRERGGVFIACPESTLTGFVTADRSGMEVLRTTANSLGIVTIQVPMPVARGEPWPVELSMEISTRLQMAKAQNK